ncbi:MAG TPA: hypothetical protein VM452_05805 [Caulifigura sp.]|jgi:hypothetical protein|nr:hypothetical protein [Caulifigura sp.]
MGSPETRIRKSPLRLTALLLAAGIGYEVVLIRHWIARVPLVPDRVVELAADQSPVGFIRPDTFLVSRSIEVISREARSEFVRTRMEFLQFPTGETTEVRLSDAKVRLATLPLGSSDYPWYDGGKLMPLSIELAQFRVEADGFFMDFEAPIQRPVGPPLPPPPPIVHPTREAAQKMLTCYCVDEDMLLYLSGESLQCWDIRTGRLRWRIPNVAGLIHVVGNMAVVMRKATDSPIASGLRPALVQLSSGTLIDNFGPSEAFDISEISTDGTHIVFRTATALEAWSLESRTRLWSRESAELGVRDLYFSNGNASLENWVLNDFGRLLRTRVRVADGQVEFAERKTDPHTTSVSAMGARISPTFALFHDVSARPYENPGLRHWLERYVRLPFGSSLHQKTQLIVDLARGRHVGIVDTSHGQIYTTSDGLGFALIRHKPMEPHGQLEFYAMPPRRDWLWMLPRAAGPPAAILLAIAIPPILRRRRHRRADLSTPQQAG